MPHFSGGVEGARGPATRQGTQQSGFSAHAQGAHARLTVSLHYNPTEDQDDAEIVFSPGQNSSGSSRSINLPDIDMIVQALNSGDPKVRRIWERITAEFGKLSYEAHPAVMRATARNERQSRIDDRERKRVAKEREHIISRLTGPSKLALHKLCGVEWDEAGQPVGDLAFRTDLGNLRYDNDGETALINAFMPGAEKHWQRFPFDLTRCEWVLLDTPDFFGIQNYIGESGYGWRIQEVAA